MTINKFNHDNVITQGPPGRDDSHCEQGVIVGHIAVERRQPQGRPATENMAHVAQRRAQVVVFGFAFERLESGRVGRGEEEVVAAKGEQDERNHGDRASVGQHHAPTKVEHIAIGRPLVQPCPDVGERAVVEAADDGVEEE